MLLLQGRSAICGELRIHNASELIEFSASVNGGTSFEGSTVLLETDVDLGGIEFVPIGNRTYYFLGTFDGQGYTISNLRIRSASDHVGLFGYSRDSIIRNVVMGSSCSVTGSCKISNYIYVGSIIGYCFSFNKFCVAENVVNMGSVTFNGNIGSVLHLGGNAGGLSCTASSAIGIVFKNCANYGTVAHTGASESTYIGGILGHYSGGASKRIIIQNCLSYGTISNSNTRSSSQNIGEIIGYSAYITIEDCVGIGKISSRYSTGYIGGVVGYLYNSRISRCYWGKDITESVCGYESKLEYTNVSSFNDSTLDLSGSVTIGNYAGTSLPDALKAATNYYYLREYSRWVLNRDGNNLKIVINERAKPIEMSYKIILLPSLANEGKMWFDGWYADSSYELPLSSFEVTGNNNIYGKWEESVNSYTITFDTRGGTPVPNPITAPFGTVLPLPKATVKNNRIPGFWENDYGDVVSWNFSIPAHNLTLHAGWPFVYISSASDLVAFSKSVNLGTNFREATVFIDSDIVFTDELSQEFESIGVKGSFFQGTFDGQGHTISNLRMKSSSGLVGLFGYSERIIIRNIVVDSSCSFTSSGGSSIGGIIRYCDADDDRPSVVENIVTMASVVFSGSPNGTLNIGSIAGVLYSEVDYIFLKNCANYGPIKCEGTNGNTYYIGGLVGKSGLSLIVYIQNCLNYGMISYRGGKAATLYMGGIAGWAKTTVFDNCGSVGEIASTVPTNATGAILGYVLFSVNITHCFWTESVGSDKMNGNNEIVLYSFYYSETNLVSLNGTTMNKINEYSKMHNWNRWFLNSGNDTVSFMVNDRKSFNLASKLVLLPDIANSSEIRFGGWYKDSLLSKEFTDPVVSCDMSLFGLYGLVYTVIFDGNGGAPLQPSKIVVYNRTYGELPAASRTGYTFSGWFAEKVYGDEVTSGMTFNVAENKTLYAHWIVNNYTVTFDFNNGTVSSNLLSFNDLIDYPESIAEREGFAFVGWSPNPERVPGENLVIKAQWSITRPSEYIEIVFETREISEEEAKKIIEKYVPDGEEIVIERFEAGSGETRVIIKFVDKDKANEFVQYLNENKSADDSIAFARPAIEYKSFSRSLSPLAFLSLLFFLVI